MTDSETDQLYVTTTASSFSDVEVTVLGSAVERKLRIFNIAGDCMLERTSQELKPYHRVSDLIHMLCQTTGLRPCRLVLLDGRVRLQPSQGFKGLWPPLDDLELQAIVVPGPSLDLGRELTMKCAEFLDVHRQGPSELSVSFQRGRLLEFIQEEVVLHHRVTLTTPVCFGEIQSTSAEILGDDSSSENVVEMQLESFLNHPMATGFKELKLHYGQLDLDFWARGEFHSHLGGGTKHRPCRAASFPGLLQTTVVLMFYWLSDLFSMITGIWLAVVMTAEGAQQLPLLLATLWLPGLAWSVRFQFYSGGRKCKSLCTSSMCIFQWLGGLLWLWQPAGLIIASVVLPSYFAYKMTLLLRYLCGLSGYEPPFPLNPDMFALDFIPWRNREVFYDVCKAHCMPAEMQRMDFFGRYEIYMRDVRVLGDAPPASFDEGKQAFLAMAAMMLAMFHRRLILLLYMFLFPDAQLQQVKLEAALVACAVALLLATLPHRSRMRGEAWTYFDSVIMAEVEDDYTDPS